MLVSWITALHNLRNRCAHHSRVWNRKLTVRPTLAIKPVHMWLATTPRSNAALYGLLASMVYLLRAIDVQQASAFVQELKALFQRFPALPVQAMGFPLGWEQEAFWQ